MQLHMRSELHILIQIHVKMLKEQSDMWNDECFGWVMYIFPT